MIFSRKFKVPKLKAPMKSALNLIISPVDSDSFR